MATPDYNDDNNHHNRNGHNNRNDQRGRDNTSPLLDAEGGHAEICGHEMRRCRPTGHNSAPEISGSWVGLNTQWLIRRWLEPLGRHLEILQTDGLLGTRLLVPDVG